LEHSPVAPLSGFIQTLWYAQGTPPGHSRERVLPSGNAQVILNLARDFLLDCTENGPDLRVSPALAVGARSVYEIIDATDLADLIGVVFRPGGFAAFVSGPVDRFSQRNVALEDVWGADTRVLRDRLLELPNPRARLLCLENYLINRFATRLAEPSRQRAAVAFAIRQLDRAPLTVAVHEVARATGWSERRFSQVFREAVGLPPKTWSRMQRFRRAVNRLNAGRDVGWAELALDCGYYDQSHFANEFRAFSGVSPTTYAANRTRWASHVAVR